MTREQRKYRRKSAIHAVVCVAVCIGLAWAASYLAEMVVAL